MDLEIKELRSRLKELENYYYRRKGRQEAHLRRREEAVQRRRKVAEEIDLLEQVRILLREVSDFAREQARQQVEYMVTRALQYTFGPGIEFKVEMRERRGQPDAEFYVVSDYGGTRVKNKPQDARGGGVVDVISLALRIALLETSRPRLDAPLILDEPGKHVSDEFAPNVGQFLKRISRDFKRQVLLVTHNRYLAESADKVYTVELKEGKSIVSALNRT